MEKELVLSVIDEREVLGEAFKIYGSWESPLFLAKNVADWIGNSNVTMMLKSIDSDEVTKQSLGGLQGDCNFLTEDGLYEVLMQSRKPIAKQFKKEVKKILKQMRLTGAAFVNGREEEVVARYFPKFSDETKLIMVQELIVENDAIKQELSQNKEIIKQQSEDVAFSRLMQARKSDLDLKQFADTLGVKGMGRNNMYQLLRDMGFIAKDTTRPYRRWIEQGILKVSYSNVRGIPVATTFVTPKGQEYLTKKILKELDKTFIHISDDAEDYARELFDIIGKSEEEYFAMLIRPESFRDEWEAVARLIMDSNEEDCYIADEIEEMLSELE